MMLPLHPGRWLRATTGARSNRWPSQH
jgi:hypothetical protein